MDEAVTKLIEATAAVYAGCATYRDEGEVVSVFIHTEPKPRRDTNTRPFTTLFVRPDRFRFEFRSQRGRVGNEWHRYVVVKNGNEIRTFWTVRPDARSERTLRMAIGGAAGISGGCSSRIPPMLLDNEEAGGNYLPFSPWELNGDEMVDGEPCVRLKAAQPRGESTMWIGRQTRLIRRVFDRMLLDVAYQHQITEEYVRRRTPDMPEMPAREYHDYWVETTTSYRPELNGVIEVSEFDREM